MTTAVKTYNIKKRYGDLTAVAGISFEVQQGEFFGYLGPNGAGKTTTMKMITGLTSITTGAVKVFGEDVADKINSIKRKIGIVEESSNLFPDLRVYDNLKFKAQMFGLSSKAADTEIERVMREFGLSRILKQKFMHLSKGQKRIITIISSIIHRPQIVFLDEPTSGLDIEARNKVHNFLIKLNKAGTTMFMTSHYLEEVEKLCSRIAVINHGKIIFDGEMDALRGLFPSEKSVVITFDRDIEDEQLPNYFKNYKEAGRKLYLFGAEVTDLLNELYEFTARFPARIEDIKIEGHHLEELFLKLIRKRK